MEATSVAVIENGLHQINLSGLVAKGIKCTTKAIMKGRAQLVLLADDCQNKDYKNLITGLCSKYNVKLQVVPSKAATPLLIEYFASAKIAEE